MKNLYCSLFGHDYKVSKVVTYHVKEFKCSRCNSEVTIDTNGELIPLTPKRREINTVLNRVHKKRLEKGRKILMIDY